MLSVSNKTLWYIREVGVLCIVLIFCITVRGLCTIVRGLCWVYFVLLLAWCDRPPKRCVASRTDQSKPFLWTCSPRPNIVNLSFCLKEIPVPDKHICWTSSSTFQMYESLWNKGRYIKQKCVHRLFNKLTTLTDSIVNFLWSFVARFHNFKRWRADYLYLRINLLYMVQQ